MHLIETTTKSKLSNLFCPALPRSFVCALILAGGLLCAENLHAMPRSPGPPFPEQAPQYYKGFDEEYFAGQTNSELLIAGLGTLEESWSGYSLQRMGDVIPFVVSALDPMGYTNVSCDTTGAFRFWINPYWSSESVTNGNTPGTTTTMLELDAVNGTQSAVAWSLQISADGNTMSLIAQTGAGLQEVLQAPISWQAGTSHNIVLNFGPQGSALFLDGTLAAQGSGLPSIPLSVGQLVIGSTLAGTSAAGADFDEFFSFNRFLTAFDVGQYYQMTSGQAALGPISAEEQPGWGQRRGGLAMNSIRSPDNVYNPDNATPCSPGGPVYITNLTATLLTNGTTAVNFSIEGGTNDILYDIFSTVIGSNSLANQQWNWIGQGFTCSNYTFYQQPADFSFYYVALADRTFTVALGNNGSGQCNVPEGLTTAAAIAGGGFFSVALLNNGTVRAWGDNAHEETNIPSGLTNVASIAAGQYHALALLTNGSVQSWGSYCDGMNFYSVTNYSGLSGPPTSNVMAIAAGFGHDLALMSNGTVVAWGLTNLYATTTNALAFQSNLTGVKAIACGWNHNVVLLSNGVVQAWGLNAGNLGWNLTNVPGDLTNAVAIAAFGLHSLALRSNGTVEAWGYSPNGETNVPAGLSNVVAIVAGGLQSLALQANGTVAIWGLAGLTNIPAGLDSAETVSDGFEHNLILQTNLTAPIILQEPTDQYAPASNTVTFSVVAESLAGLQYQWLFNGSNVAGATSSNLTLINTCTNDEGDYQVIISSATGSIESFVVAFILVVPPTIVSNAPAAPGPTWINYPETLSVTVTNDVRTGYPVGFVWQLNGSNISASSGSYTVNPTATADGNYSVAVTNAAGSNSLTWDIRVALPGMVEAWGSDTNGECDRPATLTNATAIAAGDYHSVAVTNGTVLQWGKYSDGTNFYAVGSPPALTNVVAVAATRGHDLALSADGTVTNWGLTNDFANFVPANLQPAKAIAAGWYHNIALLTNGTVIGWGSDTNGQTTIPSDLTNANAATAIAAGELFSLALRSNGTVEGWGDNTYGQTSVPTNLTGVVAIAAGGQHSLALQSNGIVVAWGDNEYGQTNAPSGMSNFMAIAAGSAHSVALKNDGTLVAWGDNSLGQTNIPAELPTTVLIPGGSAPPIKTNTYPSIVVKLIAAGGNHTMAAIFSPLVQYPIDVSKDLLLIYNTNSIDSFNVCRYYRNNRPMVRNANVFAISCTNSEIISPPDFTNIFMSQIQGWLATNPTVRPQYVILFQDIPSRSSYYTGGGQHDEQPSVQYQLNQWCATNWHPFVTAINMSGTGGTNDCIAYINKLTNMAGTNQSLFISASAGGYTNNTNWYFDSAGSTGSFYQYADGAEEGVTNVNPEASVIGSAYPSISAYATNVAGYYTCGSDCPPADTNMFVDGTVQFFGQSQWYIMSTIDSYSGERISGQAGFLTWFASNSFSLGGTNYSNTPVGAVSYVDEPFYPAGHVDPSVYYGGWAEGQTFAISAWSAQAQAFGGPAWQVLEFQAIGDPFVRK
jgi:alpha-tubulin suppressor-like RCC1 family protein